MSLRHSLASLLLTASLGAALPASGQGTAPLPGTDSSTPAAGAALSGAALLAALRAGGYVIYFRHTATDFSRNDAAMTSYADCERQRPLTDAGRQDARDIGRAIRALKLPVGERLASPFCRTLEHGRLMLGGVTTRDEIRESQDDYAGLKRLLAAPVAAGSNRWIVGHGTPFRSVAGPPHLAEGEAAVIRPETTGWTVVARLRVADWQSLSALR
jgi:hypothetical protein